MQENQEPSTKDQDSPHRLWFLPGLAANHKLFAPQLAELPEAQVLEWIPPEAEESLAAYAQRWSQHLDLGPKDILVGMSFGGQVALELAKHLPLKACLLISANRRSQEIRSQFRLQAKVLPRISDSMLRQTFLKVGIPLLKRWESLTDQQVQWLEEMVEEMDTSFFRWATQAAAEWDYEFQASDFQMPLYQIHGEKDTIIRIQNQDEVELLAGASHLLTFTHSKEINQWLKNKSAL